MHIVVFIFMLQLAFLLLCVLLGLIFIADFFPFLAAKAIAVSDGTSLHWLGDLLAQTLNFVADLARQFLAIIYNLLQNFGINIETIKKASQNAQTAGANAAKKPAI